MSKKVEKVNASKPKSKATIIHEELDKMFAELGWKCRTGKKTGFVVTSSSRPFIASKNDLPFNDSHKRIKNCKTGKR